jgi:purine-binding chemotaxis protein CheW
MAVPVKAKSEKRAARRAGESGTRTEYLAFVIGPEKYAVQIAHVAEILRPPPITQVPRASPTVLGVISVRGRLVTVIDVRARFALGQVPADPLDRKCRILLTHVEGGEQIGLLVDEVQQVWRLASEEIEPAEALGGEQPAYISGIGRPAADPSSILILLDLRPIVGSL